MNCCCCIPCSNAQQNRTDRPTGPSFFGEIVEMVTYIGIITIITPLPGAIGAFFARWGIDVPTILNCVLATIAVSVTLVVVLALVAAAMAGLVALVFKVDALLTRCYSTITSIE